MPSKDTNKIEASSGVAGDFGEDNGITLEDVKNIAIATLLTYSMITIFIAGITLGKDVGLAMGGIVGGLSGLFVAVAVVYGGFYLTKATVEGNGSFKEKFALWLAFLLLIPAVFKLRLEPNGGWFFYGIYLLATPLYLSPGRV